MSERDHEAPDRLRILGEIVPSPMIAPDVMEAYERAAEKHDRAIQTRKLWNERRHAPKRPRH